MILNYRVTLNTCYFRFSLFWLLEKWFLVRSSYHWKRVLKLSGLSKFPECLNGKHKSPCLSYCFGVTYCHCLISCNELWRELFVCHLDDFLLSLSHYKKNVILLQVQLNTKHYSTCGLFSFFNISMHIFHCKHFNH